MFYQEAEKVYLTMVPGLLNFKENDKMIMYILIICYEERERNKFFTWNLA